MTMRNCTAFDQRGGNLVEMLASGHVQRTLPIVIQRVRVCSPFNQGQRSRCLSVSQCINERRKLILLQFRPTIAQGQRLGLAVWVCAIGYQPTNCLTIISNDRVIDCAVPRPKPGTEKPQTEKTQ